VLNVSVGCYCRMLVFYFSVGCSCWMLVLGFSVGFYMYWTKLLLVRFYGCQCAGHN